VIIVVSAVAMIKIRHFRASGKPVGSGNRLEDYVGCIDPLSNVYYAAVGKAPQQSSEAIKRRQEGQR
jgi:hypothetical protein